jgi:hypothetical protein
MVGLDLRQWPEAVAWGFRALGDAKAARSQAEAKYHGEWAYTADPKRRAAA